MGEVGAGLGFTSNGMAALAALGADEAVRAAGHLAPHAGYQGPEGRWLLQIPKDRDDLRAVTTICGVHRQRLPAALRHAAEAARAELITGAEVTGVSPGSPGGEPAIVTWRASTGAQAREAALVVAADGVRRRCRRQCKPARSARAWCASRTLTQLHTAGQAEGGTRQGPRATRQLCARRQLAGRWTYRRADADGEPGGTRRWPTGPGRHRAENPSVAPS